MDLRSELLKSIWYGFTALDLEKSGKVSKSQLKVSEGSSTWKMELEKLFFSCPRTYSSLTVYPRFLPRCILHHAGWVWRRWKQFQQQSKLNLKVYYFYYVFMCQEIMVCNVWYYLSENIIIINISCVKLSFFQPRTANKEQICSPYFE